MTRLSNRQRLAREAAALENRVQWLTDQTWKAYKAAQGVRALGDKIAEGEKDDLIASAVAATLKRIEGDVLKASQAHFENGSDMYRIRIWTGAAK